MSPEGKFEEVTQEDVRQMKAYIDANRTLNTPFDIVVEGRTAGLGAAERAEKLTSWIDAGATWWIGGCGKYPLEIRSHPAGSRG
jgi:hypothetical protein